MDPNTLCVTCENVNYPALGQGPTQPHPHPRLLLAEKGPRPMADEGTVKRAALSRSRW